MVNAVNLTHRQQQVLWATVRHYIATAEPVGSEALVKEYNLSVSSATIRNAMGVLEKVGLLYQPHTSAGRVPSDSGYRIYVDQLITPANELNRRVEQLLSDRLQQADWSLEAMLRGAAQILATMSGCIALITMPQAQTACLRHVQLVAIDPKRVMLIFVTDSYETQSILLDLSFPEQANAPKVELLEQELQILSNFLNEQLRGRPVGELTKLDWSELDREFQRYGDFLQIVLGELARRSQSPSPTQMMVSGLSEVLRQPEFSEVQQVQTIMHLLEDKQDQLLPLIFKPSGEVDSNRRIVVWIGSENPLEPMRTCTLIASTYNKGTVPVGSVGVIGPTRMMYENAIAMVEAAADYLSETLSPQSL
ncbi:MAG TPA: heat-inducible transcriptional repressor HrcA [Leptolyngbyaceae cyanobacterium M33_DOE_097]|uniref:Heat-inducible transcription repressor HrcA n=1 Tax=Oscillatoriales cyanobacterium SpSt-418 TaxID=2282169 RepID=A0A7C3PIG6_9CYAN|nr:heat-inducible transcriptional repressor HrcA [Leptolyngbyaceae cyanobacterium M33_DOE_097]